MANNFLAMGPFLSLTQGLSGATLTRLIRVSTFSSLLIMLGSFVLGTAVLQFFGIGVSAFQIAGGLLLGASGLKMLHAKDPGDSHEKTCDITRKDAGQMTSSAIVPISLPRMRSGDGTIAV